MDKLKKVVIALPKGQLVVSSVVGTYQLFSSAIRKSSYDTELIVAGEKRPQKYMDGCFAITPQRHWQDVDRADLIIIPAIEDGLEEALALNAPLMQWLMEQHQKGARIGSLCTGSFLLAEAGLLDGKRGTTHWLFSALFQKKYKRVNFCKNNIITEDDGIFTSGGAFSFLNLIIYLAELFFNKEIAQTLVNVFQIDYHRSSQEQFVLFETQKRHNDEEIVKIQEFIEEQYPSPLQNPQLAKLVNLGTRSMVRRFKAATGNTPIEYLQRVRVEAAKEMLANTNKQITEVQYEVGYNDPKMFREVFSRYTGLLPKQYRLRYSLV